MADSNERTDADRVAIPQEFLEIRSPWNDLRYGDDVREIPFTAHGVQSALAALQALCVPTRFRLRGWSEEQLGTLEAMRGEWRMRVIPGMPTTAELTWAGLLAAVAEWFAEAGQEEPRPLGPGDRDLLDDIVGAWLRWIKVSLAHRVLAYLTHAAESENSGIRSELLLDRPALAVAAERCVHEEIGAQSFALLRAIGGPDGEAALARLCSEPLDLYDRAAAREALWSLRKRSYSVPVSAPARSGDLLVPPALSEAAVPWACGFVCAAMPYEPLPYTSANLRLAQRMLAGCEEADAVPRSDFPSAYSVSDDEPDLYLVELDTVLAAVVPYVSMFTRENLAVAQRECRLLGIVGEAEDSAGNDLESFGVAATSCLVRAIAGAVFDWLARNPEPEAAEPWSVEAAARAVRRGVADKRAMQFLLWSDTEPSRRTLARIASDASLPAALRAAVSDGVDLY